eukprot:125609-Prorocentrum_lima.AAC.1
MVPYLGPSALSMPPMPPMSTPPSMSTPGASSNLPGHLNCTPGVATPQCSPGNGECEWGPGRPAPSFGAGSRDDIDSLKTRKKLPTLDF